MTLLLFAQQRSFISLYLLHLMQSYRLLVTYKTVKCHNKNSVSAVTLTVSVWEPAPMKLSNLMSTPVVTCSPDDTLRVVNDIFKRTQFHHVLVVEQSLLVGVVSDRDIFKALSPNVGKASASKADLATLNKRVSQIMTHSPVCLPVHAQLIDVVKLFNEHIITCVPIVNEQRQPVGIVTWRDIMRLLLERYQSKAGK